MASKLPSQRAGHRSFRGAAKNTRRYRPFAEPVEPRLLLTGLTFYVDSLTDTGTGNGLVGDLRYAITQAETFPGSTIDVTADGTVVLGSELPDLSVDTTITDDNPGNFVVQGGGDESNYRALTVDNGVTASISGLDFLGFSTTSNGGILLLDGGLTLTNSTLETSSADSGGAVYIDTAGSMTASQDSFVDNTASNGGGAIYSNNNLNVIGGSVAGNSASEGGGIFNNGIGDLNGVYIAFNTANTGGGIDARQGPNPSGLTLTNSTITGNSVNGDGGGISAFYAATLTNDTIANNSSGSGQTGAGLYVGMDVSPLLDNTLIANNMAAATESDVDGPGSIDSGSSYNLLGNSSVDGISNGSQGNLMGTSVTPMNAHLASLADNGGSTATIALNPGSPALGAGLVADAVDPTTSDPLSYDERGVGFPRVVNNSVDIGAFQTQVADTNLAVLNASGVYGATATLTATLTSGGDPIAGELVDFHVGATDFGTATTDVNGVATIPAASLAGLNAGLYTEDVTVSFAGDSSFGSSNGSSNLNVTQASLTITANNKSKVYGAALPTFTASYSGFVNGDTAASLTSAPTLSTTATSASHVSGSPYAITANSAVDSNYSISYVPGSLSITTASLTITANNQSKVYGAALPTLTASYSGFVNGDTSASLSTAPTLTTTATSASHVTGSPYSITASAAVDTDYTISYVAGSLNVTTASLTITSDNQTKVYGSALPTLTASYSGLVNGDTAASLSTAPTLTTTATSASHVAGSPYSITASAAVDTDYTISYVAGSLTVTTAPLTITANNQTKVYGAALPTLTASYSGFVNGDTAASLSTAPTLTTTATTASHVAGNPYNISASAAVDTDYSISYVPGGLTITTAPLTITANNQSKVYGAALPTLTASYTGFVNGDTSASLSTPPTITTTATSASHVAGGPYSITASAAVDTDYTISYVAGSLNVTTAPLTITSDNQSKVYGSALPTLTASYSGLVNGDTAASLSTPPTLTTTATSASHVAGGPYSITASAAVDTDYSISYVFGGLTVTPAPLTITANNQSNVYGDTLPTLTASYSGFVNGDTAASLSIAPTITTTATSASHVAGSPYSITASGVVDTDYAISYVAGNLIVTPAPLTITAEDQITVYGDTLPTLTASYSGFVNGDTAASLSTAPTITTTATQFSDVSDDPYGITASAAVDADYTISYDDGNLIVTPAPLTILVADQSKVYGQVNPVATGVFIGALNGDDVGVTYGTVASQFSDVANYLITPTGVTGAKAIDYSFSVAGSSVSDGLLTVTPAPLAIVVNNQSKVYGQANPALTGTVAGILNNDDITAQFATAASTSSDVVNGGYAITFTGLSGTKSGDYVVTNAIPGTLTVSPAPLTVTANPATKVYGQANPAFGASYSGFVLGQDPSVLSGALTLNTPATPASHVGGYAITPSGLTSADYAITNVSGTLEVTPAPLVISGPVVINYYGQAIPTLSPTISGFVNGDTAASLTTPVTLATQATSASHVGAYGIVPFGAASPDYSISYNNGAVVVVPAIVTVTANGEVVHAVGPTASYSATYSGFVNGDTAADLTTPVSFTTPATSTSVAGIYPIIPYGESSPDYKFINLPGPLVVESVVPPVVTPVTPPANPGYVAFVNSLYLDLIGQAPSTDDLDGYLDEFSQGVPRATVALQVYHSNAAAAVRASHHGKSITLAKALSDAIAAQLEANIA